MNTKLTLRLDENLIQSAKLYSAKTGQSISRIVSNYFSLIDVMLSEKPQTVSKITSSLKGCLKNESGVAEEIDYKKYLESKYL
jgi:hypothetical protein